MASKHEESTIEDSISRMDSFSSFIGSTREEKPWLSEISGQSNSVTIEPKNNPEFAELLEKDRLDEDNLGLFSINGGAFLITVRVDGPYFAIKERFSSVVDNLYARVEF